MSRPSAARTIAAAGVVATAIMLPGCGETAHSQKVRQEARGRYDRASAQIVYDQARQSFHSGQFEQALGHVDKAIGRYPKDSSYHLLRGRILHEMMRVEESRQAFAQSATLDPAKPEPHYFMGIIHQRWRENDRAAECYGTAARLDPSKLHFAAAEVEVLTLMGQHGDAEERLADLGKRFEFSPVIDRLHADLAKMKGDHDACAQLLERAAVRETSSPELLEELAFARYSKGDWNGSLSVLDDPALADRGGRPDLARLRARNLILVGRPAEARDALLSIKGDTDPEGRTAMLLGHASWRLGDWGRLRDCGRTLVSRRPDLADGYLFQGAAAGALGQLDDAIAFYEAALAREPERHVAQRLMADAGGARDGAAPADPSLPAAAGALRSDAP